jgi:uncharacterized membrane protein
MSRKIDKKRSSPPSNSSSISQVSISHRSAPLPHPSELEGYEQVLPGAADRIIAMVETQSAHRQQLENKAISIEGRNSLFGIIAGLLIGVTGILTAGYCISSGYQWGGGALGGTTLASLVYTFVYGTRQRRVEREQKYIASKQSQR